MDRCPFGICNLPGGPIDIYKRHEVVVNKKNEMLMVNNKPNESSKSHSQRMHRLFVSIFVMT